ncbi:MAG: hypothetical protein UT84_C0001G0068 [Candidatus Curtissbacteria bacterium GW2011_GWA1_40_16]|uniref:M23ase beta-sheet core domain-containing protein n=1 Tax=Candidatus Curtissbacteria bacterium GW2011_GWA1_40_16 TaxID=1618405 RepID=A0A0G0RFY9_9BACT|nr:MAG: hypothetical protein UT84_C0001G0068 [Candidatus Curtissbacteria bacterium GW2011_GWA1_40_16]
MTESNNLLFAEIELRIPLKSLLVLVSSILFLAILPKSSLATNTIKPQLVWQRSAEAPDKIVKETTIGSKLTEALGLPLDSSQKVFDDGVFTPQINKNHVQSQVHWVSWSQYSAGSGSCGPIKELRHFQAKFNLATKANIQNIQLKSPYYPNNSFPINDNAYIYINGSFVKRLGTSYGASNLGFNGTAPYANETDGWFGNGNLGQAAAQYLIVGENKLDIVAGETCKWGGMGKLELVLEQTAPQPFLDLPWDYQGKGLSFSDAALAINSYFDHEYPLLSSGLSEPDGSNKSIIIYKGPPRTTDAYSSHDGYDYGKPASANINDPLLAAAGGVATYSNSCDPCGNMVLIDHGNGYQTRYMHLLDNGLITRNEGEEVTVTKGQQIGKVGFTGHVIPPGDLGAHIHFMVVQDKNGDGNFDDNIPDGITDPFGWQSEDPDPWPNFNFSYGGQNRSGNSSYYLWTKAIPNLSTTLTANGAFFELERYKLNFPQGATDKNLDVQINSAPTAKTNNFLRSIGSTITVSAKDAAGNIIHSFQNFFTVTVNFSGFDLTSYKQDTISIYSSEDGINWNKEITIINLNEKTASAQINHLSHFALMADRLDTTAPTTEAVLSGNQGQQEWYGSDVQLSLNAQDNTGGLGVEYTLYKVNDEGWQQYNSSVNFSAEGNYKIQFYSADKDENIEDINTVEFNIDKTSPTASITASPAILWPPNGKMIDVLIYGHAEDNNGPFTIEVDDEYNLIEPTIDNFGQTIQLQVSRRGEDLDGRKYRIKAVDLAGNEAAAFAEITVLHDQRK